MVSESFYIFGVGKTARIFYKILKENNNRIIAFLSSHMSVYEIENIPVINLSDRNCALDRSVPVVIAVFNREENADMNFISDYLKTLRFKNIINIYDFFEMHSSQIDNLYWLTKRSIYKDNLSQYLIVRDLFKERRSIDIFDNIMEFLKSFDTELLLPPDVKHQYFPQEIDLWNGENTFFDIGSFDGQTLIEASQKFGKLETAIAYEPDPINICRIKNNINYQNVAEKILIIPCGVWSKTEIMKFSALGGEGSSIKDDGEISIQCLSLDETLIGVIPGYVKMDIEGAELQALKGAEHLIKRHKPALAISLYHLPEHLHEIPLLIQSWDLGYDFYIRCHGHNLFETVLYCTQLKH
jgi:FkbM family methyltransferase